MTYFHGCVQGRQVHNFFLDVPVPCASLSQQARDFMIESGQAEWGMVDLSGEGLKQMRKETSDVAREWCELMKQELGTKVENGEVSLLYFFGDQTFWMQIFVFPVENSIFQSNSLRRAETRYQRTVSAFHF